MQIHRLDWYLEEYERIGAAAFRKRYDAPALIARDNQETETEASFHTAFMSRSQFAADIGKLGAASEERIVIRAGEVRFVQKPAGAAFADRVGVGRARNADISLPNPKVSKYHAYFEIDETGAYLTDADSKNGTWVDDNRLPARERTPVHPGALVVFGPYRFVFHDAAGFCEIIARRSSR